MVLAGTGRLQFVSVNQYQVLLAVVVRGGRRLIHAISLVQFDAAVEVLPLDVPHLFTLLIYSAAFFLLLQFGFT